jgi:hypothetical protein
MEVVWSKTFFSYSIPKLVDRWNKYVEKYGVKGKVALVLN